VNDDFEVRLRDAFHRGTLPSAPSSLHSAVERTVDTRLHPGGNGRIALGRRSLGALAVAAVLAAGSVVALSVGNRSFVPPSPIEGPATPSGSAFETGSPTSEDEILTYEPQWAAERPFDVDDLGAIVAIEQQRLDELGLGGVTIGTDDEANIAVHLPPGVEADAVRRIVAPVGMLELIALDNAEIQPGASVDSGGMQVIADNSAGVDATVRFDSDLMLPPTLTLTFGRTAADQLAEYTSAHVGSTIGIVLDHRLISAPMIMDAVSDGQIEISFGEIEAPRREELELIAALVGGGPLPVELREVDSSAVSSDDPPLRPAIEGSVICESPLPVDGLQLDCETAVRSASTILPSDHPAIERITFVHDCNIHAIDIDGALDCATQLSGTVTFEYVNGSRTLVAVGWGHLPSILPELPISPS
jgi:hypothetical protein